MPFPVTCHACGKSFSISDEVFDQKIKGRVVTVKCKQCQTPIRVDGTKGKEGARVLPAIATPSQAPKAPTAADENAVAPPPPAVGPKPVAPSPPVATGEATAPVAAAPEPKPAAAPEPKPAVAPEPKPAVAPEPKPAVAPEPKPAATAAAAPTPAAASPSVPQGAAKAAPSTTTKDAPTTGTAAAAPRTILGTTPRPTATAPTASLAGVSTPKPAATAAVPTAPRLDTTPKPAGIAGDPTPTPAAVLPGPLFAVDLPGGDRELTENEIVQELGKGRIGPDTLVWREGMAEWLEIRRVPELLPLLKRSAAKASPTGEPDVTKAESALGKPAASAAKPLPGAAAPTGRFRARQPTLPMGMVPDALQAKLQAPLGDLPDDALTRPAPEARVVPVAKPAVPEAKPVAKFGAEPKLGGEAKPAPEAKLTERKSEPKPALEAKRPAEVKPAPKPAPEAKAPAARELLPYERPPSPAEAAKPPSRLPAGPSLLSAASVREQAAALLARPGGLQGGSPGVRAGLPLAPIPETPMDEEPTILRPSPFAELEETPSPGPRAPLPTPVRELMGVTEKPSVPAGLPPLPSRSSSLPPSSRPSPPSRPVAPSPAPPSPPRPPPAAKSSPAPVTDTFRATPEAKRSWFPEDDAPEAPPPPPAPMAPMAPTPSALLGAPPAPPPAPPPPMPLAPSTPMGSPFGVGPARMPDLSPSSAFAAAANPALMSSPLGAPPMPSGPAAFPPAGSSMNNPHFPPASALPSFYDVAAIQAQRRRMFIIMGVAAVVLILGGLALTLGGSGSAKPPSPAPATPAEPAAPAPEPPHAAAPADSPPSAPGNAPSDDSTKAPSAPATNAEGSKDPPSNGSQSAPGGGFADMFASGAKQAQPGGAGRFDPALAKAALDEQLGSAGRCREPGGPTGMARVAVTFAPNGSVSSATISEAPFAGTSVGNCISEAMKQARVKPFTGVPPTVSERVSIR